MTAIDQTPTAKQITASVERAAAVPHLKTLAEASAALHNMLANFSALSATRDTLTSAIATLQVEGARRYLDALSKVETELTESERAIIALVELYPALYPPKKKTISTPVGDVAKRESTTLEIDDEELTKNRIREAAAKAKDDPDSLVREDLLLKQVTIISRDALKRLDDATLLTLNVRRVKTESVTVNAHVPNVDDLNKKGAQSSN